MAVLVWTLMVISLFCNADKAMANNLDEELIPGLAESYRLDDEDLPVVLTATRLRQPRAEVPASVTVIDAEQIEAWNVTTLPELMRFVPGMFIGHGDDENNASLAYHSSSPSVMRRLQVLVDGRSVFRAGIASVVWDDIPIALEDIQRIEVTRGPSSATYGSNSFQGVINIISKHPGDTLGVRLRYRNGNQGEDDSFASYSWQQGRSANRLTVQINASDGFDGAGAENGADELRDSKRHGFINFDQQRNFDGAWQLHTQAAYKSGHTDIRKSDYDQVAPDQDTRQGMLMAKLSRDFNANHSASLRAYWQHDRRTQETFVRVPTALLDPALYDLYRDNPQLASQGVSVPVVSAVASGASAEQLEALAASAGYALDVSESDLAYLQEIVANTGGDLSNLSQQVNGYTDSNITDERFDIEFQDTRRWNRSLRTVLGVSMRRDQVTSETYFGGKVNNDTYRFFGNLEWRQSDRLIVNMGGTYEREDANKDAFSPRVGLNLLLAPQQGIRLIHSEAVRSPDLLEQNPNYNVTISGLDDNYLGISEGTFFIHQWPESRDLDHERIISTELGYYGRFSGPDIEVDLKLFQEHMTHLIADSIQLRSLAIGSDSQIDIDGAELQVNWRIRPTDWIWLSSAYINVELKGEEGERRQQRVDTRLSAQDSVVASWHHKAHNWSLTASHFWYDAYNSKYSRHGNRYRRYEISMKVFDRVGRFNPWLGFHLQHLVDDGSLVYVNQQYSTTNLYNVQVGLNF
ncbi:TonB-dependent siderophore receptor [Oceanobacter sp. 3_MG-2023]|uniref:TonB-dependent receptor plug domain-containing protein n=2 Tax=Gammaproteobacteria TaxID=1236 RepID=UPI002734667C|nr:TonB-dependent receptor [Oceanobacter sp. 3_MG-2023]MDP2505745.1 TonB-dependent receptor plug domain-containing protein [Oceanobacter sp. 3_MG-2023]